jgi:hypothetical protein
VRSRSCVVHFDRIDLATAFFRSACHWRFGLKNCLLAAKWRCPAPGVPTGGCYERWARPGRSYYPPSACSKMPRSILLVFDLDGVLYISIASDARRPRPSSVAPWPCVRCYATVLRANLQRARMLLPLLSALAAGSSVSGGGCVAATNGRPPHLGECCPGGPLSVRSCLRFLLCCCRRRHRRRQPQPWIAIWSV